MRVPRPILSVTLPVLLVASTMLATTALAAAVAPPEQGSLLANVYTMASAEYRACCLSIFRAAAYRLVEMMEDVLEDSEDEAAGEMPPSPLRPAVVMDLDQTVLDITSFQTFLYENGLSYTPALWSVYEREGVAEVLLVPGAREFIETAESLGVSVVYLSNRNEANGEHTVAALKRLGLNIDGIEERLYLKPTGASSDKSPRRDAIAARYNVVMIVGDNLRDFSEVFKPARLDDGASADDHRAAIAARDRAVDDAACHWGVDWFVLPNAMYGEWQKLVPPNPVEIMRPTDMDVPEGK